MTAATRDPQTGRFTRPAPDVVALGALTWTAAEDAHPLGALIGWHLAVVHGTPVAPQEPALAGRDTEAELIELAKAATT